MKHLLISCAALVWLTAAAGQNIGPDRRVVQTDGRYTIVGMTGADAAAARYDVVYPLTGTACFALVAADGQEYAIDRSGNRLDVRARLPRFDKRGIEAYVDYICRHVRFRSTAEWERMRGEVVRAMVTVDDKGRTVGCAIDGDAESAAAQKVIFAAMHAPYWTTPSIDYEQQGFMVPLTVDFSQLPCELTTFYPVDRATGGRIDCDFESPLFRGGDIYAFLKWTNTKKYIKNRDDYYRADNDIVRVAFTIDERGRLCEAEVLSYKNDVCRDKAMEILAQSPRWQPARIDGRAVPCRYTSVNINFRFHR